MDNGYENTESKLALLEKQAIGFGRHIDADVLVARLRVAVARLRLMTADVEEVGALLKAGRIAPAGALEWLRQGDLLLLCLADSEMEDAA